MERHEFLVIIEQGERNFSAYSPDLPGCVATGKTIEDVLRNMSGAIEFHLEGLREESLSIPKPHAQAVRLPVAWVN